MPKRNYFIIFLLLLTIFISWPLFFSKNPDQSVLNSRNFPLTVEGWNSKELPLTQSGMAFSEVKDALLRCYTDHQGRRVYLYIAYSPVDPKISDPPELTYQGSNISIIDKGNKYITIASSDLAFKVNWLLIDDNENQQMVYYWFKSGKVFTRSYWKEKFLAAFNKLRGKESGNALIRISADIVDGHQQDTVNILNEFACLIIPQLYQYLP